MSLENEINIAEYAENSYLEYAMSVVKGRAIPSVEDGLKPVHRRIFYSMYKMGISDTSIPKKCARITGDVIGKYHPHGDVAVYEAMVNQAQLFRMRHAVIEGVGNFGSRDGDGAAAARYTECKFYPISKVLFEELDQNAVDFIPNYDGNETEPRFMPARLPFILLNVNEGIGVGMATNIPSHNLREVVSAVIGFLENDKIELPEILNIIKGPDFPTGAQLISSKEEINKVYKEGRGSFRLRAKYFIEDAGTKKWKLVFTELPFAISVKQILEEIDFLFNPEDKVKKDSKGKLGKISLEQSRLKQLFINLINNFSDESDKKNPLRLVIEPKSYKQDPEELASILLGTTSMESNFSANFVAIGRDGNPRQKTLMEIISEWTSFRLETIERRCRFHLDKIAERLHILDGRKIILHNIDDVIKIIKTSKDPKTDLMSKYLLSEIQAQDVLDLRLRQLGNLELESIEKECKEKLAKKLELEKIIATPSSLKKQTIKELKTDMEKYGSDRVTEINEAKKVDLLALQEKSAKVSEEEITVAVSSKGWIKALKGQKTLEEITFKEGDKSEYLFQCKNTDTLAMFDIEGKVYNYPLNELTKDGAPINTLAQFNAKVSFVCPVNKNHKYLLSQDSGYGFIVHGENLLTKMKAGKEMIKVDSQGHLFQPLYFSNEEDTSNYKVAIITTENKFVLFKLSELSEIGKGKGVTLCGLPNDFKIKQIKILKEDKVDLKIVGKKDKPLMKLEGENLLKYEKNRSASSKGSFLPLKEKMSEVYFA